MYIGECVRTCARLTYTTRNIAFLWIRTFVRIEALYLYYKYNIVNVYSQSYSLYVKRIETRCSMLDASNILDIDIDCTLCIYTHCIYTIYIHYITYMCYILTLYIMSKNPKNILTSIYGYEIIALSKGKPRTKKN